MNLRFLETFIWLAKLRNFRLTAEKLNTTQASISSRIAALEQDFGVRLFERRMQGVQLTQHGAKALAYAENIVKLMHDMRAEVSDPTMLTGVVRIGVIDSIVHSWLSEFLARVRREYPRISIELTSDTSLHLCEQLDSGGLDLSLQTLDVTVADIGTLALGSFPMRWIASPALGAGLGALDLAQLAEYPVISFARKSPPHRAIERLFASREVARPQINCFASVSAIIQLTLSGVGVATLPPAVVYDELQCGKLHELAVTPQLPDLPLISAYRLGPENPMFKAIAQLAHDVMHDYAAARGERFARLPNTASDIAAANRSACV